MKHICNFKYLLEMNVFQISDKLTCSYLKLAPPIIFFIMSQNQNDWLHDFGKIN